MSLHLVSLGGLVGHAYPGVWRLSSSTVGGLQCASPSLWTLWGVLGDGTAGNGGEGDRTVCGIALVASKRDVLRNGAGSDGDGEGGGGGDNGLVGAGVDGAVDVEITVARVWVLSLTVGTSLPSMSIGPNGS